MTHNASNLERIVAATGHRPQGLEVLVSGEFNADLEAPDEQEHNKTIALSMATESLDNMVAHLISSHHHYMRYGKTWSMLS